MYERVHHFEVSDLAYPNNLAKAAERLRNNQISLDSPDVFDLIEMFNICLFLNDFDELTDVEKKFLNEIKLYDPKMKKALNLHFQDIDPKTMASDFATIKSAGKAKEYTSVDYFKAFDCYFRYKKSSEEIGDFIVKNAPLDNILRSKKFSDRFSKSVKTFMLEHPESFELMVTQYDVAGELEKLWVPKFSKEETDSLIDGYVKSEDCSLSVLKALIQHRNSRSSYCVSEINRVNIKNKIKQFEDPLITKSCKICEPFGKVELFIPSKSLDFNDDNEKALRFLCRKCKFVNEFDSIEPLFNKYDFSMVTRHLEKNHANQYGDQIYECDFQLSSGIFIGLYDILKDNGILLEDLAVWFIENKITPLLNGDKISLRFASEDDYLIKCERLFNLIPMLLRKYRVFVEHGNISIDLLLATKDDMRLGDYPSLIEGKYFELNENSADAKNIMLALFTYHSQIEFSLRGAEEWKPLFDFVLEKKAHHSFCQDFVKNHIDFLIDKSILKENGGLIDFSSEEVSTIWKCLYNNLFIPSYLFDDKVVGQLNTYVEKQLCKKKSKLFSSQEADYLDFVLNNSRFSNALALRNLYEHGNGELLSSKENKNNYLIGLRTLFAILYKIYLDLFHYRVINGKEKHQPKE